MPHAKRKNNPHIPNNRKRKTNTEKNKNYLLKDFYFFIINYADIFIMSCKIDL